MKATALLELLRVNLTTLLHQTDMPEAAFRAAGIGALVDETQLEPQNAWLDLVRGLASKS